MTEFENETSSDDQIVEISDLDPIESYLTLLENVRSPAKAPFAT